MLRSSCPLSRQKTPLVSLTLSGYKALSRAAIVVGTSYPSPKIARAKMLFGRDVKRNIASTELGGRFGYF